MAIYMQDTLASINYDFSKYPTLASIVEGFDESWVYGNYNSKVPDIAHEICASNDVNLFSVNEMVSLFKKQEKLLAAVRVTLNMLKESNLYKIEKGIPIMEDNPTNIHVSGITGSSININSNDSTASVKQTYNEPIVFQEMINAIKSQGLGSEIEGMLIDNTQMLATSHETGTFNDVYKDFMQNISAHITVFTPFLPVLASLL